MKMAPQVRGFRDGHWFYIVSQYVVAGALHVLADLHVEGMERCPPEGGVILAMNHRSTLDIPLIGAWGPRPTIFFAKSEVRQWPVLGGIGAFYGSIYARRGEADRQAIREVLASLAAGQVIGLFLEGHRTRTGGLLRAQPGVALLAQRAGVPVWPVAVTGSERIGRQARPQVWLRGGEPFDPIAAAQEAHGAAPSHQQVADVIMRRIAALLPEDYRGVYR